jgi:hypothetical protein
VVLEVNRVLQRASGTVFPEVNALAQPVEIIPASREVRLARKNPLCNSFIAAVEAECVGG